MDEAQTMGVGAKAPDFTLPKQGGGTVSLHDLVGNKVIVLYFYPKDDTPGCTAEACSFRDSYEVFKEAGAEVIGVSADSVASHDDFATKYHLPFTLLSDEGGAVATQYGVPLQYGFTSRYTFVIDQQGVVRQVFSKLPQASLHMDEALRAVRELQAA